MLLVTALALATSLPPEAPPAPEPWVAAGLSVAAPLGLLAVSMVSPYPELGFLVPATLGAGHVYAGDPFRGLLVSAGGVGASVVGLGLGAGTVALWPGTPAESLSRVLWGGVLGTAVAIPVAAWDARRTAERRATASEGPASAGE
jgi:hypothetical protein